MKFNNAQPIIETRATRSLDAKLTIGILELTFKNGNIKMKIHAKDRDDNKQLVADLEQIISRYVDEKATKDNLQKIADEILEKAEKLQTGRLV